MFRWGTARCRCGTDSEVAEVKPLKLKKMEVEEAIPEEDEEMDVPVTRGRRKATTQQASGSAEVRPDKHINFARNN
ncbi:unnamed protein product [Cylicostephanus goldi]|uniref:Uncharacterized protein n=1 Tax=Cylicostephanus goldi TaxID=71465 RepID=A0A3P6SLL7_CYLGO|nr:unnamed protein product [Cylicostephanus goldi]